MQSTTADYQTEEAKNQGAIPKTYIAIMRTTDSIDPDDGTHNDTEEDNPAGGGSWTEFSDTAESGIYSFTEFDNSLFFGTGSDGKIYEYNGSSYVLSTDTVESRIRSLAVYDSKLYACADDKVLEYDGTDWTESTDTALTLYSSAVYDSELFVGCSEGKVLHFGSTTWSVSTDRTESYVYALAPFSVDSKLYGCFTPDDSAEARILSYDGTDWSISTVTDNFYLFALCEYNNNLYATGSTTSAIPAGGDVFSFNGTDWTLSTSTAETILSLGVSNNLLYGGGVAEGKIYVFNDSSWTISTDTLESNIEAIIDYDGEAYAGTYSQGKLLKKPVQENIKIKDTENTGYWESTTFDSAHLTPNVIFDKVSWSETLNGGTIAVQLKSASTTGGIAAATYATYTSGTLDHTERYRYYKLKATLTRSSDPDIDDDSWTTSTTMGGEAYRLEEYDGNLYCGLSANGIITVFDGTDWTESTDTSETIIYSLKEFNNKLYASTSGGGKVYELDGTTWTLSTDTAIADIYVLNTYDSKLYAGSTNGIIFSYDGTDWTESTDTSEATIRSLKEFNNKLYAGSANNGKIYSYDGTSWTEVTQLSPNEIRGMDVYNNKLFVGCKDNGKIYEFDSTTWTEMTDLGAGLANGVLTLYASTINNRLYAGAGSSRLFEYAGTSWTEIHDFGDNETDAIHDFNNQMYVAATHNVFVSALKSPQISDISVRHKALIPKTDYINLGTISYGVNSNFYDLYAGNCTVEVDNSTHQFEKLQATSYIYNLNYRYKKLEIWAGFELADTSMEWLIQYLGEIENIVTTSGRNSIYTANIITRDFIFNRLNKLIGTPLADGTPNPYCSGKRYRYPCIETNTTTFVYNFYIKQAITSIDAVKVRDSGSQQWVAAGANATNVANKEIDFVADPGAEVSVDITINTINHPVDIIENILTTELNFNSDLYDTASFTTAKAVNSSLIVGVRFENITAIEAIKQLLYVMDGMIYIEGDKLKIFAYASSMAAGATQTFIVAKHFNITYSASVSELENYFSVPYDNYIEDTTKLTTQRNLASIRSYGKKSKSNFSFRYQDPVSIHTDDIAHYNTSLIQYLNRFKEEHQIIDMTIPLDIMRTEIFDLIATTNTKHNFSAKKFWVIEMNKNLSERMGSIRGIIYGDQ